MYARTHNVFTCMYVYIYIYILHIHMGTKTDMSHGCGSELPSACVADQEKEPAKFETFWTSYGKYFKACQYVTRPQAKSATTLMFIQTSPELLECECQE